MKRSLVVGLAAIMVLFAAVVFAAQPLGGPAEAEPGHSSLSAGYFYTKDRWSSNTISGDSKFQTNAYYGQFAYGLARGWGIYFRTGSITADGLSNLDIKDSNQFFMGAGMHGRLFEKKDWHLALGPIADFTWYSNWKDRVSGVVPLGPGPFYHYETAKLAVTGVLGTLPLSDPNNVEPTNLSGHVSVCESRSPKTWQCNVKDSSETSSRAAAG